MQLRTYPAFNVLYCSFRTSLLTIHDKIGTVARDLYAEAARQHILVTGPVYWFYYGADGKPETEFTLEIALPVSGEPLADGLFKFKKLPPFKCLSTVHEGAWTDMGATYGKLFNKAEADALQPNGVCREVYLNIDFSRDEYNLTEIQLGLN
jgi:effector-binding domain-containing protein